MSLTPQDKELLNRNILSNKKMLASNSEMIRELREVKSLLKESNEEFVDGITGAKIMNSKNPRILQKLREGGYLKLVTDYYFQARGFMYRRQRLVEIKNDIIQGRFGKK